MSFYNQQKPPQMNQRFTFPNTGPPIFSTGPNPVFHANATPPYQLQPSQAKPTPPPLANQSAQYQTGPYRSLKGLFDGANWKCNCNPRRIAAKFQVKKESANKGRWFYRCGNSMGNDGPDKCSLFLWEDEEVMRRQTHPESDPPGPTMNTGNASAPTPEALQQQNFNTSQPSHQSQLSQPSYQLPPRQMLHNYNNSSIFPQGSTSASGLTTPAITPSKRQSSRPSNIQTAYKAPSPYSSPLHSPPESPTTFSQRVQPPRQAKSPKGKSVAFETSSEATSEEEYDSDATTESLEDEEYETESWGDDVPR